MTTLFEADTKLFADSIESYPFSRTNASNGSYYFACGTYQLDDSSVEKGGTIKEQNRIGLLHWWKVSKDGESMSATLSNSWEVQGILDMKWSSSYYGDEVKVDPYLVLAQANGQISVFKSLRDNNDESVNLSEEKCGLLSEDPEKIHLSVDIPERYKRSGSSSSRHIVTSTNQGAIERFVYREDGSLEQDRVVPAHEYEAWIVACNPLNPDDLLASGGDDCSLKLWDLRTDSYRAVSLNRKEHTMGVTCIQYHPTREHFFASGSYDENIRLWDERNLKSPISNVKVNGGIWRLRWSPNPETKDHLLTGAMLDGYHIVKLDSEDPQVLRSYQGNHKSLAYGVDWIKNDNKGDDLIASCSFYDHLLSIWRP